MNKRSLAWLTVMTGALAFAVSGLVAGRPIVVSVSLMLDAEQGAVGVSVVGPASLFASSLDFPKAGHGVSLDWKEAKVQVEDVGALVTSVRSVDRDRVSLEIPGDVKPHAECKLVYWMRPGRIEPIAEDVHRATGMIATDYGAVDLDTYLPRPGAAPIRFELSLDSNAVARGARLISRGNRRFLVWHPSAASILEGALNGVRLRGAFDGEALALERVARRVARASAATELPYVILDPTGLGAYVNISDGVLILRTSSPGPRSRMSLGSVLWGAAWNRHSQLPSTTFANNVLLFGSQYLGMAAAAESEELSAVQGRAIKRFYHALSAARVRPIPARPIGKENWHLLIPGLLAMFHAGLPESAWGQDGFLAAMSSLPMLDHGEFLDRILEALSHHSSPLGAAVEMGRIPGLECSVPDGVQFDWFAAETPSANLKADSISAPLDVIAGANVEQYLEACGCKSSQAGGLARRATVLEQAGAMSVLRVDCGGFLSGIPLRELDAQDASYANAFLEAFSVLPMDAVTLGYKEICAGLDRLLVVDSPVWRLPLVCANLYPPTGGRAIDPFRVVPIDGRRVAVLGWLGTDVPTEQMVTFESGLAGWTVHEDLNAIRPHVTAARSESEIVVLIGDLDHMNLRANQDVLEGIDIVITSDGSDPSIQAFRKSYGGLRGRPDSYTLGRTVVLSVPYGTSSMLKFNEIRQAIGAGSHERIVLDDAVPSSPTVETAIAALSSQFDSDVSTVREESVPGMGFVGADRCSSCHAAEYQSWLGTRHATAMETLQNRRRDRHAGCVACHVTAFGVDQGFSDGSRRSKLQGIQCEACHGPGELHATSLRRGDIVRAPAASVCLTCHDAEHSDQFNGRFDEAYWAVSHQGPQR